MLHSIVGQPQGIALLETALSTNQWSNAYLLLGNPGVGKRTAARWFAQSILEDCSLEHPDLLWIEPTYTEKGELYTTTQALNIGLSCSNSPQIRIEQIREVNRRLQYAPTRAQRNVVVIESAEHLSTAAANAMLKSLESPETGLFILTCNDDASLLLTIRSRCQVIPFLPLSSSQVTEVLEQHSISNQWAKYAQGSPGKAVKMMQCFQEIGDDIRKGLGELSLIPTVSLSISRLRQEVQIQLLRFMQISLWQQEHCLERLAPFDRSIEQLLAHANSQAVWSLLLIGLHRSGIQCRLDIPHSVESMPTVSVASAVEEAREDSARLEAPDKAKEVPNIGEIQISLFGS